jgi:hypothetical protein
MARKCVGASPQEAQALGRAEAGCFSRGFNSDLSLIWWLCPVILSWFVSCEPIIPSDNEPRVL